MDLAPGDGDMPARMELSSAVGSVGYTTSGSCGESRAEVRRWGTPPAVAVDRAGQKSDGGVHDQW